MKRERKLKTSNQNHDAKIDLHLFSLQTMTEFGLLHNLFEIT